MGSIWCADYDEVDVRVFKDAVQCAVYPDGNAESFLQFPAGRGGAALKNGSEREEVGQCEDERDAESKVRPARPTQCRSMGAGAKGHEFNSGCHHVIPEPLTSPGAQ